MRLSKGPGAIRRLGPSGDFFRVFAKAPAFGAVQDRFKVAGDKCGMSFSRRLEFPVNPQLHHDANRLLQATLPVADDLGRSSRSNARKDMADAAARQSIRTEFNRHFAI
jgi:hypothetical protein